jgi:hypothetical protein
LPFASWPVTIRLTSSAMAALPSTGFPPLASVYRESGPGYHKLAGPWGSLR